MSCSSNLFKFHKKYGLTTFRELPQHKTFTKLCSAFPRSLQQNSTNPAAGYPDRLGPSGKFVENSTKLSCLEITGTVQCYGFSNFKSGVVERFRGRYTLRIVTTDHQTNNVAYFQRKIQLSGFSAYPNGSPTQLIQISGVLLYMHTKDIYIYIYTLTPLSTGSKCALKVEWMRRQIVLPAYNDIGLFDTSSTASDIVSPINFSLLTKTLHSSVITTLDNNDTKYSAPTMTLQPS